VPDSEAPFDPDGGPGGPAAMNRERRAPAGRLGPGGSTAITLPRPTSPPVSGRCDAAPSWSGDPETGGRRTAAAQLPPAARAARVFATALVEVLTGRRPIGQLRRHTAPTVFAGLVNRVPAGWTTPAHLMSVRLCQPADGIVEVSATIRSGARVRAIAFRIEGVDERWRVTALDIG
jgi:hypothetical protein